MNMISPFIVLFFAAYLRETNCISNIAHVLSRVAKKEKETKNTIKLDLCFISGGMQQCNS